MTFMEYLADHAIDLGGLLILGAFTVVARLRGDAS